MSIGGMLKGHDLFSSLSAKEVDRVSQISSVKNFEPGETVFKHGTRGTHIYLLLEGRVYLRIPTTPEEVSLVTSRVEKGEVFGLSPMLGSDHYTASAHAEGQASVLAIEAKPFRDTLQSNCTAGFAVMNHLAHVYFSRYINTLKNLQSIVNQIPLIHL